VHFHPIGCNLSGCCLDQHLDHALNHSVLDYLDVSVLLHFHYTSPQSLVDGIVSKLWVEMKREDGRVDTGEYLALQVGKWLEKGVSIIHYHFKSFLLLSLEGKMNEFVGDFLEDEFANLSSD
jgi:hypothetical protein